MAIKFISKEEFRKIYPDGEQGDIHIIIRRNEETGMDLNKVLEKELDAWLVVGKKYEIGIGKDKPGNEPLIAKFAKKNPNGDYCFTGDIAFGYFDAWYLAKVGIKEVVEEKKELEELRYSMEPGPCAHLTRPFVYKSEKQDKQELKQRVLAQVDDLISREEQYIEYVKRNFCGDREVRIRATKAKIGILQDFKEGINDL